MLMPVNYECPHYYAAEVLTEMEVLNGMGTMVVWCSLESLTMCYIDWNHDVWQRIWQLVLDFFDMHNALMPNQVNLQC